MNFEYIWYTILKRNDDMYEKYPKYLFAMIDKHVEFNNPKESKRKNKYDKVEIV